MPPPMISSRFGTSVSSSAPVESMRRLSSYGKAGDARRLRSGGDDAVVEGDGLDARPWSPRPADAATRTGRAPRPRCTLRALASAPRPLGQLVHDAVLELAQPVEVDLRLAEREPEVAPLLGVGDHLRGVQQRLGRNAADVQADAADARVALDQDDLLAEVGGAKRGGVAAGTGAEHQHLGVEGRVGVLRGARPRRHGRGRRARPLPVQVRARAWRGRAAADCRPILSFADLPGVPLVRLGRRRRRRLRPRRAPGSPSPATPDRRSSPSAL